MKELKEWIETSTLSKKDKVLFFSNMKEHYGNEYESALKTPVRGFAYALSSGFQWHKTPEGFHYWNKFASDPELNKNNIE